MKISTEQSREIYELAKHPSNRFTNEEIGKKFRIDEATVRYHIKKWERKLHEISKINEKVAGALASHTVNVALEVRLILEAVKANIEEAKTAGVSPEKLAPLYGNWIKSLELASELLQHTEEGKVKKCLFLDEMEEEEARLAELKKDHDFTQQIINDPEAADLACKLLERLNTGARYLKN